MEDILNYVLCLIENLIIFATLHSLFYNYRREQLYFVKYPICIFGCSSILFLAADLSFLSRILLIFILVTGCCFLLFHREWYVNTAFSITFIFYFSIIDIICGNFFTFLFDQHFIDFLNNNLRNRMIVSLIVKVVDALVFYFMYHAFRKIRFEIRKREWILLNLSGVTFLVVTVLLLELYPITRLDSIQALFYFIASFSFFISSTIVIYFFTEISAYYQKENRMFLLENNYRMIEEYLVLQNQVSGERSRIRHDYKNWVGNAMLLIKSNEYSAALELLTNVNSEISNIHISLEQTTGNFIMDAVVSYKAAICEKKQIPFEYVLEVIPELMIKSHEISSILSNLLDNAMKRQEKQVRHM